MSPVTLYVPCDSAALAVGADEVAAAVQAGCDARGQAVQIVRNGSRGLPGGHQVEDRGRRAGRAERRGLQCRRRRLGHLQ